MVKRTKGLQRYAAAVATSLLVCGAVLARQPAPAPTPTPRPLRIVSAVREVSLVFSAIDKKHQFVTGLNKNNIEVLDNNVPQRIRSFIVQGNLPLRIAVVIDTSSSVGYEFRFEQQAAIDFLAAALQRPRDKGMVVAFDTKPHFVQPLTGNLDKLTKAIRGLAAGGGTALFDSVYETAHDKLSSGNPNVRRVIVIISDGADNYSRATENDAVHAAENAGAVIYTVGTEPTGEDAAADNVLKTLASATGGRSFFPLNRDALAHDFQSVLVELRNQYVVSYQPNNFIPNGAFHRVKVKIDYNGYKGFVARTRKGYYAERVTEN